MTRAAPLLDPADAAELGPPEAVRLPLDLVDPNPHNPRRKLNEIDSLADNIRQFGQLQPILVRRNGERFEIVGGHRRFTAFQRLAEREPHDPRWRAISAKITHEDNAETLLEMLVSGQVHIDAWAPKEEAAMLELLMTFGYTASDVGKKLNKSVSWASKRLRVYTDSVLSGYVQTGELKRGIAEEILPVLDLDTKKQIAEDAATRKLSQDQVKGRVRALRLDNRISHLRRLVREVLEELSTFDPREAHLLPIDITRDLWTVHGRIEVFAKGSERKVPTIEEAQRAAGIKSQERPLKRGEKRKPGYKPRRYDDIV